MTFEDGEEEEITESISHRNPKEEWSNSRAKMNQNFSGSQDPSMTLQDFDKINAAQFKHVINTTQAHTS
jgi:hypothetical protein